jgi:hypothetical protein
MRLFESHPDLSVTGYTFYDAFFWGPERLDCRSSSQMSAELVRRGGVNPSATYQNGFNRLQTFIADAEAAGKIPFIKEHIFFINDPEVVAANIICLPNGTPRILKPKPAIEYGPSAPAKSISLPENPTVLPNDFLATFLPVILIRHPAKMIPSYYRAAKDTYGATVFDEEFPVNTCFRWSRLIFDWYQTYYRSSNIAQRPIVIDAEDVINDSHNIAEKFCTMVGLDHKYVQYSWAAAADQCDPIHAVFQGTLRNSTGIVRGDQVIISHDFTLWFVLNICDS